MDVDEPPTLALDEEAEAAKEAKREARELREAAEVMRLPQAPVDRIVRETLSTGFHASKEVRTVYARALSVFILSVGTGALEATKRAKRKGIVQRDVTQALARMQLNLPELRSLIQQFKQQVADQKAADNTRATVNETTMDEETTADEMNDEVMILEESAALEELTNLNESTGLDKENVE